jgi:hypothetical protein
VKKKGEKEEMIWKYSNLSKIMTTKNYKNYRQESRERRKLR